MYTMSWTTVSLLPFIRNIHCIARGGEGGEQEEKEENRRRKRREWLLVVTVVVPPRPPNIDLEAFSCPKSPLAKEVKMLRTRPVATSPQNI